MRRKPVSKSLHQQLNSYTLAASAAGVGILALAFPAEAKIIYTPAHHVIGANSVFQLDLDHDEKADFTIRNLHKITSVSTGNGLWGFWGYREQISGHCQNH
jgi:hypothetical protein